MAQVIQLLKDLNGRVGSLETRMGSLETRLEARMGSLETRLEARMDSLDTRVNSLAAKKSGGGGSGGGGGGGGGGEAKVPFGGSGSGGSGSGTSSPKSSLLRAAYSASSHPAIALSAGCTRLLPEELQRKLWVHRLRTEPRLEDFDYVAVDIFRSTVLPNPSKGFSLFVVASEDPAVVAAAHAARGAITKKHHGCVAWRVDSLPPELVVTLDRALERSSEGGAIVWHATLSPKEPMDFAALVGALAAWRGGVVCEMRGAAGEEREGGSGDEDEGEAEAEAMAHLSTFSETSAPYAMAKLNVLAAAMLGSAKGGGSPGSPGRD